MVFQFHDGTIRSYLPFLTDNTLNEFQFHDGTIRSSTERPTEEQLDKFQFHDGTIRSQGWPQQLPAKSYFNSTMVRLEAYFFGPFYVS